MASFFVFKFQVKANKIRWLSCLYKVLVYTIFFALDDPQFKGCDNQTILVCTFAAYSRIQIRY
jgi:hypothetical protein